MKDQDQGIEIMAEQSHKSSDPHIHLLTSHEMYK